LYDISWPTVDIAPYHVVTNVKVRGNAVSFLPAYINSETFLSFLVKNPTKRIIEM